MSSHCVYWLVQAYRPKFGEHPMSTPFSGDKTLKFGSRVSRISAKPLTFFFFFFGRYDFSISVFVVKFGIFGSWDMSTILLSFCMESSLGVKYNLILALRSQIFECCREAFYRHALECLQSASSEKKKEEWKTNGNAWPWFTLLKACRLGRLFATKAISCGIFWGIFLGGYKRSFFFFQAS